MATSSHPVPGMPSRKPAPAPTPTAPTIRAGAGRHTSFEASLEFFLSPLVPFLRDPDVNEIMVNGHNKIYIEKAGQITLTTATFPTEADVQAAANNIAQFVGQTLTRERPLLDGRLPDGSRICIVLGGGDGVAHGGTHINIRRFGQNTATPEFLLEKKSVSPMAMEFLLLCVKAHRNIVVSGGAGSGKTTCVNVLTSSFGLDERIVVIEDTRELQVQRPHVVQMEARPADVYGRGLITIRDLFTTALRMRPDRIVVGEVRRGEALDMIQAMTSGHHGSLTTLHASTPIDTLYRLETMALMADVGIPLFALRRQVASAIDVIVQTARLPNGCRLITHITECHFDEATQNYAVQDIFNLDSPPQTPGEPTLAWTGTRPEMLEQLKFEGFVDHMDLTKPMLQ
ncbi:MAG: Flp pilus assembly complex ATPase component TadA [Phycisphaerales bacterium]|nr:Flp pilus assembly complex ATPase component TadA [Phycisphaerales bacterium]